nr:hypothetical protein WG33_0059 [uncultured bacterium]
MFIALDYDDTYTKDPTLWNAFIGAAQQRGHTVACVTWRRNNAVEAPDVLRLHQLHGMPVYFTDRRAKLQHMANQGIRVDVWIDDRPDAILTDEQIFGGGRPQDKRPTQAAACAIQ